MTTLKIYKDVLQHGLNIVSKTASSKSTIPILGNILLESNGEFLKLGATNLEAATVVELDVIEADEFSTTVPARIFNELVSAIRDDEINFEFDESRMVLKVESDNSKSNIKCLNPVDFPEMPVFKDSALEMPAEDFRSFIQRSSICCSSDASKPIYAGVYLETQNGVLNIVATDGFRFSVEKLHVKCRDFKAIIPAQYLNDFSKASVENVELEIEDNFVVLKSDNVVSSILTLDGQFPNLKDFPLDTSKDIEIVAPTLEFYLACKHANIFCDDDNQVLALDFKLITDISAQADQIGDSMVNVATKTSGQSKVHLNAQYLMDFFSIVPTDNTLIYCGGEESPVVFKIENNDNYYHVMMPIRI